MSQLALAWRLARRELRGGLRGFGVFLACLTLGVATITAVGLLDAGVLDALKRDATQLMGGDFLLESNNIPIDPKTIAQVAPPGARRADVVRTNAMAYGADERHVVVGLKAVDDAYPLYGEILLDPPIALDAALAEGGAVVERGLLARLGLEIGDSLQVGEAAFTLRAVIEREPDRIGSYVSIGPRVLIHLDDLERTGTILPGSLANYAYRFALPPGADLEAVLAQINDDHPDAAWRARSFKDVQPRITRTTDRLASYLTMAGLTALLIGGIGVALAIRNYLAGKTATIATFKCLGAPSGLVFRIYLLQVLAMAGCGAVLGLAVGQMVPWLLGAVAGELLPIRVALGFYPAVLLLAAASGLLTAVTFALVPLGRAREVSPAGMFRAAIAPSSRLPAFQVLALVVLVGAGLVALSLIGVPGRRWLAILVAGAIGATALLTGLAVVLIRASGKLDGRAFSPATIVRGLLAPLEAWPPLPLLLLMLAVAALAALALFGVPDRRLAAIFVVVAIVAGALLTGLAVILVRSIAPLGRYGGARLRLALANLHRPGAGTAGVVTALGGGFAVLTMVAVLEHNLAEEIRLGLPERVPGAFLIDIQRDQIDRFEDVVASVPGAEILQIAPVVRGRVVRIKGVPIDQAGISHWTLRRDRGLSYAAARPEGSELVAGEWWPENYAGPPLVSLEIDVAEAYGVDLGDRLSFNVLGRVIEAEIANLRGDIEWSRGRLDFVFVFSPGVLEAAPHTFAAALDVPDATEAALLDRLAEELPNVTPITIREIVTRIGEVMAKVRIAVGVVAGVTVLSGILVLAGAVAAARRRHLYESVVLKVLGARRADLLRLFLIEYLGLGILAAIAGGVLGTAGAAAVAIGVMDLSWSFPATTVLLVLLLAVAVTLVAGFTGTWRLLGRPAAPVLRAP